MADFNRLKMKEIDLIDEFVGKFGELLSKLVVLGEDIEEIKFVRKFFDCLLRKKYIFMVVAFE